MMTIAASDGLKLFIPQVYDIVWSLIILVIVALFFHKFFMPKFNAIFDERAAKIEGNIAKAEQSKKDADAAKAFAAFSVQPEQQKVYSSNIAYGPANKKAVELLDPALLKDMPTTPENIANQVAMNVTFWADFGEQLEQRFNAWAAK